MTAAPSADRRQALRGLFLLGALTWTKTHLDQTLNVSPAPEPASLSMLAGGLGLIALKRRRHPRG